MHLTLSMDYGGLERIVNLLTKKLDKTKFEVTICCLDRGGYFFDELKQYNIPCLVLSRKPGVLDLSVLRTLIGILRKQQIDILHSHSGCAFYAAIAGRLARVPMIIHTDHGRLIPDRRGLVLEDRVASRMIDRYVAVSQELYGYLLERVRVPERKLVTIRNGVETDHFKPISKELVCRFKRDLDLPEQCEIIGTVCRLEPVKNLVFMIETLKSLVRERRDLRFMIVGDGPERAFLEQTIRQNGIGEKTVFWGQRSDVERIIPAFDIFVLPSLSEGTSMTLLEAMSCGVPVIASEVGGNPSIIQEGKNGYLFRFEKPEVLRDRAAELLDSEILRRRMGEEGRRTVSEKFSFNYMLEQYMALYASV